MSFSLEPLPLVQLLPDNFSLTSAFAALSSRPGCLWLDSAAQLRCNSQPQLLGRYSFLTSDPVERITANIGDENPWPLLDRWCDALPTDHDPTLPPFQGGIAGAICYEAASWLEDIALMPSDALSTPAISLGLYDWTIAVDHDSERSWLICQGLQADSPQARIEAAHRRRDQVLQWLQQPPFTGRLDCSYQNCSPPRRDIPGYATEYPGVTSNFRSGEFGENVEVIVRRIRAGDFFQVNLAQRLVAPASCSPEQLYSRLRVTNPAPYAGFYRGDEFTLLSSSPEGFLTVRDRMVQTRPIKGTVARTGDISVDTALAAQLAASAKDRAENIMIVDLMRNDLSRVCIDKSVVVSKLCSIERYQYVQHLVSVIQGRLRDDQRISDLLKACFPGGSVTGAPKIEAMRTIAELEPNRRGPYCGSLGYISCSGAADFNILIRCIVATGGMWYFPVGGGITARSNAAAEEAETWTKAVGMLRAILQV